MTAADAAPHEAVPGDDDGSGPRRVDARAWADRLTGGSPLPPLIVLFGLNMVDELDRSAFAVLLPDIRDNFGLDNTGILGVVAVADRRRPAAHGPDRHAGPTGATGSASPSSAPRRGASSRSAPVWRRACGCSWSMRCGSAIGNAVIFPTHNSLLSDYYPPAVRPRVFSFHRSRQRHRHRRWARSSAPAWPQLGGWRTPFFVFAIPTVVLVVSACG